MKKTNHVKKIVPVAVAAGIVLASGVTAYAEEPTERNTEAEEKVEKELTEEDKKAAAKSDTDIDKVAWSEPEKKEPVVEDNTTTEETGTHGDIMDIEASGDKAEVIDSGDVEKKDTVETVENKTAEGKDLVPGAETKKEETNPDGSKTNTTTEVSEEKETSDKSDIGKNDSKNTVTNADGSKTDTEVKDVETAEVTKTETTESEVKAEIEGEKKEETDAAKEEVKNAADSETGITVTDGKTSETIKGSDSQTKWADLKEDSTVTIGSDKYTVNSNSAVTDKETKVTTRTIELTKEITDKDTTSSPLTEKEIAEVLGVDSVKDNGDGTYTTPDGAKVTISGDDLGTTTNHVTLKLEIVEGTKTETGDQTVVTEKADEDGKLDIVGTETGEVKVSDAYAAAGHTGATVDKYEDGTIKEIKDGTKTYKFTYTEKAVDTKGLNDLGTEKIYELIGGEKSGFVLSEDGKTITKDGYEVTFTVKDGALTYTEISVTMDDSHGSESTTDKLVPGSVEADSNVTTITDAVNKAKEAAEKEALEQALKAAAKKENLVTDNATVTTNSDGTVIITEGEKSITLTKSASGNDWSYTDTATTKTYVFKNVVAESATITDGKAQTPTSSDNIPTGEDASSVTTHTANATAHAGGSTITWTASGSDKTVTDGTTTYISKNADKVEFVAPEGETVTSNVTSEADSSGNYTQTITTQIKDESGNVVKTKTYVFTYTKASDADVKALIKAGDSTIQDSEISNITNNWYNVTWSIETEDYSSKGTTVKDPENAASITKKEDGKYYYGDEEVTQSGGEVVNQDGSKTTTYYNSGETKKYEVTKTQMTAAELQAELAKQLPSEDETVTVTEDGENYVAVYKNANGTVYNTETYAKKDAYTESIAVYEKVKDDSQKTEASDSYIGTASGKEGTQEELDAAAAADLKDKMRPAVAAALEAGKEVYVGDVKVTSLNQFDKMEIKSTNTFDYTTLDDEEKKIWLEGQVVDTEIKDGVANDGTGKSYHYSNEIIREWVSGGFYGLPHYKETEGAKRFLHMELASGTTVEIDGEEVECVISSVTSFKRSTDAATVIAGNGESVSIQKSIKHDGDHFEYTRTGGNDTNSTTTRQYYSVTGTVAYDPVDQEFNTAWAARGYISSNQPTGESWTVVSFTTGSGRDTGTVYKVYKKTAELEALGYMNDVNNVCMNGCNQSPDQFYNLGRGYDLMLTGLKMSSTGKVISIGGQQATHAATLKTVEYGTKWQQQGEATISKNYALNSVITTESSAKSDAFGSYSATITKNNTYIIPVEEGETADYSVKGVGDSTYKTYKVWEAAEQKSGSAKADRYTGEVHYEYTRSKTIDETLADKSTKVTKTETPVRTIDATVKSEKTTKSYKYVTVTTTTTTTPAPAPVVPIIPDGGDGDGGDDVIIVPAVVPVVTPEAEVTPAPVVVTPAAETVVTPTAEPEAAKLPQTGAAWFEAVSLAAAGLVLSLGSLFGKGKHEKE